MGDSRRVREAVIGLWPHKFVPDEAWEDFRFCIFRYKDADGEHHFCGAPPEDSIHVE